MGLSVIELEEGDTLYAYTDGISDNLTVEELQEALKQNGGQIAGVLEGIQERIQAYDRGSWVWRTSVRENGAYRMALSVNRRRMTKGSWSSRSMTLRYSRTMCERREERRRWISKTQPRRQSLSKMRKM